MTKTEQILKKEFSRIIWESEVSNMTLSEYLDSNQQDARIWNICTDIAIASGFNIWELQTK